LRDCAADITALTRPAPAVDLLLADGADVAFLDYQMPGSSGLDVLRQVRAAGCRTPIVILTGLGNEELAVKLMKAGATDYLAKSRLAADTLGHALRNALHIGALEKQALAVEEARRAEEVSRHLLALQEEERRRLSSELHDRTSPNLSALAINLGLLADMLPHQPGDEAAALIEDTYALLKDTISSIGAISADFRPPVLDYAGFWPALDGYAQQMARRTGIAVHAERKGSDTRLLPEIETSLFRIAQQALANCARHSLAQTVYIGYTKNPDSVELAIADDGVGFDADGMTGDEAGARGLAAMRERAEFIGGRFTLETHPGRGTRIAVAIPAARAFGAPVA
jgi:signal transduction histidine kinase